jgi:hypothetical protein
MKNIKYFLKGRNNLNINRCSIKLHFIFFHFSIEGMLNNNLHIHNLFINCCFKFYFIFFHFSIQGIVLGATTRAWSPVTGPSVSGIPGKTFSF